MLRCRPGDMAMVHGMTWLTTPRGDTYEPAVPLGTFVTVVCLNDAGLWVLAEPVPTHRCFPTYNYSADVVAIHDSVLTPYRPWQGQADHEGAPVDAGIAHA